MKLIAFRDYYNGYRGHAGLKGETPVATLESKGASLKSYRWRQHCRGLYQTPMAVNHEFARHTYKEAVMFPKMIEQGVIEDGV